MTEPILRAADALEPGSELHDALYNLVSAMHKNYRDKPLSELSALAHSVPKLLDTNISDSRKTHIIWSITRMI